MAITVPQAELPDRVSRQSPGVLGAQRQQDLSHTFLSTFSLKNLGVTVNAFRPGLIKPLCGIKFQNTAQLVYLLVIILPAVPRAPEAGNANPERFNRVFITAGDITEKGEIERRSPVELLSPRQNLAGPHAEILRITE